ncbi:MAG TPA: DUF1849 family protein, partial [Rhodospirillales bacterium]|nr:DUF1849 family protein [Rhodospirillales bacterium]
MFEMVFPGILQRRRKLVCGLGAAALFLASLPLEAANLVSHRAFYSLRMGEVRPGGSFVNAEGAMTLIMEKSCDGWILTQNLLMDLGTPEGRTLSQRSRFTGLESFDGKNYRFLSNNDTTGEQKRVKGKARSGGPGAPGEAIFILPEEKTLTLPERTLFPVAQTSWVIDQAIAGVRHALHYVFDGSDGTGPRRAAAFIGPLLSPGKDNAQKASRKSLGALAERPGW